MNRRQKIIVSVTGIFLVLLLLVGLTYAYFLTKITGNTNDKSITVTTANLELVYGDGNGVLTPAKALIPGDDVTFLDASGNEVTSKTFSVENKGDDTDYVITLEDVSVTYASDSTIKVNGEDVTVNEGDTTTFESNDFKYTLTCTIESADATRNGTSCNGASFETLVFTDGILVGNIINVGDKHNYTLTMEYLETGIDQSNDMNKAFSALINIDDFRNVNPYSDNKESLTYNIINNAMINKNGTKFRNVPLTKIGLETTSLKEGGRVTSSGSVTLNGSSIGVSTDSVGINYADGYTYDESTNKYAPISLDSTRQRDSFGNIKNNLVGKYITSDLSKEGCHNSVNYSSMYVYKVTKVEGDTIYYDVISAYSSAEATLSITNDDYGNTYYFRGSPIDNYVNFDGKCWRIVRIEGDGATKLILSDNENECNAEGYTASNKSANVSTTYGYLENDLGIKVADLSAGIFPSVVDLYDPSPDKVKYDTTWCIGNTDTLYSVDAEAVVLNQTKQELMESKTYFFYEKALSLNPNTQIKGEPKNNVSTSLMCSKKNNYSIAMRIGTLTADEFIYAGASTTDINTTYYLYDNSETNLWTLTETGYYPNSATYGAYNVIHGQLQGTHVGVSGRYVRPVISLKPEINIASGEGTQSNPYVIE